MDAIFSAQALWFVAGAAFLLAELALPGFVSLFFGLGAFAAALGAWAGLGAAGQFLLFLAVSLGGIGLLRRMFLRVFAGRASVQGPEVGEDIGPGRPAEVTRDIAPGAPGEIKFRGSFWRAEADRAIPAGSRVVIVDKAAGDSGTYRVRPAGEE